MPDVSAQEKYCYVFVEYHGSVFYLMSEWSNILKMFSAMHFIVKTSWFTARFFLVSEQIMTIFLRRNISDVLAELLRYDLK